MTATEIRQLAEDKLMTEALYDGMDRFIADAIKNIIGVFEPSDNILRPTE